MVGFRRLTHRRSRSVKHSCKFQKKKLNQHTQLILEIEKPRIHGDVNYR